MENACLKEVNTIALKCMAAKSLVLLHFLTKIESENTQRSRETGTKV